MDKGQLMLQYMQHPTANVSFDVPVPTLKVPRGRKELLVDCDHLSHSHQSL